MLKDLLGKLNSWIGLLLMIYLIGMVVNNANLETYGAFSWKIIDLGNFTSGALLLVPLLLLAAIIQIIRVCRESENSYSLLWKWISISGGVMLVVCIILIATVDVYNKSTFWFQACVAILVLIISLMISFLTEILIYINNYIKDLKRKLKDENKDKESKEKFYVPIEVSILFGPVLVGLFVLAFIFGRTFYSEIPRSLGGGAPYYVKLEVNSEYSKIISPNKIYEVIDETNDSFIMKDIGSEKIYDFYIDRSAIRTIEFVKEIQQEFSFFADSHIIFDSNDKKYDSKGYEYLRKLKSHWNNSNIKFAFALGDIWEEDSDTKKWKNTIDRTFTVLNYVKPSLRIILGNNDYVDSTQFRYLTNKLIERNFFPEGSKSQTWNEQITDEVYAVGLFIPDKFMDNLSDEDFDISNNYVMKVDTLLSMAGKDTKLILVLTHHGFVEDNPWSYQYRNKAIEQDTNKRNKWISFVSAMRKSLLKYDKDYERTNSDKDVIVVSGHYHSGFMIRNLDGIDHIVCPSLRYGTRDSTDTIFQEETYLDMNYYPEQNKVIFINKVYGKDCGKEYVIDL